MSLINPTVYILVLYLLVGTDAFSRCLFNVTESLQTVENLKNVAPLYYEFTSSLYKNVSESGNDNILISPANLYVVLFLLADIAEGSSLDELNSILYNNEKPLLMTDLQALRNLLKDSKYDDMYTITAIRTLYDCPFDHYFTFSQTEFACHLFKKNSTSIHDTAYDILKNWIELTADNKINLDNIFCADSVEREIRIMFLSTINFKGTWLDKFDKKNTQLRDFHVSKTEINLVPTMVKKTKFNCGEIPEWKASFIEIPYMNSDFVMVILLPYEEVNLQTVENNFDWKKLANAPRFIEEIELYLPKFKFHNFFINFVDILKKMGVITMFSEDAEFESIFYDLLRHSHLLQQVFLNVDEGTEAAAKETVAQERSIRSAPRIFAVERPFLFAIEYKPYKIPLLLGSMRKLNYESWKDEL
ncbi:ovalbumin-related protein X-like [Pseudomyrmex gracilis]|uniref:ovalbumin-related protein X-like n=1 Tax=Pseudomyrmex gracilis TaxID=219809 RepID=UPI00099528AA|nr:ovalbumin-related protein X-like [Pseudomyrmex gracilis]